MYLIALRIQYMIVYQAIIRGLSFKLTLQTIIKIHFSYTKLKKKAYLLFLFFCHNEDAEYFLFITSFLTI